MSLEHLDILEDKIKVLVTQLVDLKNKTLELEKTNTELREKLAQKDRELQQTQANIQTMKQKVDESADYEKERDLIRTKVENMLKHLKKLEGNI